MNEYLKSVSVLLSEVRGNVSAFPSRDRLVLDQIPRDCRCVQ